MIILATMSAPLDYPKLRPVEVHPATYQGQSVILLQDPLQLSGHVFLVHHPLNAALAFFDGQHSLHEIETSLDLLAGLKVDVAALEDLVRALDDCMLLESDAYQRAFSVAQEEYRRSAYRPALLSGLSYPEDPGELRAWLDSFDPEPMSEQIDNPFALIVPHLDYERGGQVYANVFTSGREAILQADLVVIFGTDHHSPSIAPILTRQDYATPYGVAPTAQELVDGLQAACPEIDLFEHELYHLGEHSIELALVWVQHLLNGKPVEFLPIMAGSVQEYLEGLTDSVEDPLNLSLGQAFRDLTAGRRIAMIASADLAHIGPVFGGDPVTIAEAERLHQDDMLRIDRLCQADINGFLDHIRSDHNKDSICGSAPIYRMLTWEAYQSGHLVGYTQCDAEAEGASLVSACGIVFEK